MHQLTGTEDSRLSPADSAAQDLHGQVRAPAKIYPKANLGFEVGFSVKDQVLRGECMEKIAICLFA